MVEIMWFGVLVGICGVCFLAVPVVLTPFALAGGLIARARSRRAHRTGRSVAAPAASKTIVALHPSTKPHTLSVIEARAA